MLQAHLSPTKDPKVCLLRDHKTPLSVFWEPPSRALGSASPECLSHTAACTQPCPGDGQPSPSQTELEEGTRASSTHPSIRGSHPILYSRSGTARACSSRVPGQPLHHPLSCCDTRALLPSGSKLPGTRAKPHPSDVQALQTEGNCANSTDISRHRKALQQQAGATATADPTWDSWDAAGRYGHRGRCDKALPRCHHSSVPGSR